jgi:hypothetical protein
MNEHSFRRLEKLERDHEALLQKDLIMSNLLAKEGQKVAIMQEALEEIASYSDSSTTVPPQVAQETLEAIACH